jgi:hypothetical protein
VKNNEAHLIYCFSLDTDEFRDDYETKVSNVVDICIARSTEMASVGFPVFNVSSKLFFWHGMWPEVSRGLRIPVVQILKTRLHDTHKVYRKNDNG